MIFTVTFSDLVKQLLLKPVGILGLLVLWDTDIFFFSLVGELRVDALFN